MTLVNIDLRNQGYETGPDDRVVFYSLLVREGDFGTISTAPVEVDLVEGKATVDLAPGPVGVQIIAGMVADTRVREGRVPMEGPTTLNVVLTLLPEYSDAVRASFLASIRGARDEALGQVEGAVADEVGGYLSSIAGRNILDLAGSLPGHALQPDGSVSPTPTRTVTDFIPVEPSTQYVWSVDGVPFSSNQAVYQAYSADKTLAGGQRSSASFDTTSTTRFIRASILTDVLDKAQLEKGATPTEYVAHGGLRVTDVTIAGVGSVSASIKSLEEQINTVGGSLTLVEDPPGSGLFVIGAP